MRPEFLDIRKGLRPRLGFAEYVTLPEYREVQSRMLGTDSFPYRNVTVDEEVTYSTIACVRAYLLCTLVLIAFFSVHLAHQQLFDFSAHVLQFENSPRSLSLIYRYCVEP